MEENYDITKLEKTAKEIRKNIVEMVYLAQSGHPGGALSIADILTALYFTQMNVNPNNPKDENRDRFVLSKGHCCPALYATLAEKGFFDKETLKTFRKLGSIMQGHPDVKKIPGVDMTTGSLGQGLSVANGMALAGKLDNKDYRVYCMLGDGEIEEGQVWEAAMSAGHYKLDNLCAMVDNNNLQIDGNIENVMNPKSIEGKFKEFGFEVISANGHDFDSIISAFEKAKSIKGKPTAIVFSTIKGKGVSYMQDKAEWHGKAPNEEQFMQAMEELK